MQEISMLCIYRDVYFWQVIEGENKPKDFILSQDNYQCHFIKFIISFIKNRLTVVRMSNMFINVITFLMNRMSFPLSI